METSPGPAGLLQAALLSCGIIAALLSLGTDWLADRLLKGYSFTARSMSELGARGSPTRALVVALTLVSGPLMIAFGAGIWRAGGQALLPRLVAALVIGNALAGLVATAFFPNRYGVRPVFGEAGVLVMFLGVLCFVLAMAFGAAAYRGWFRLLSAAIPVTYLLLALLRFASAARSPAGGSVSLIGAQERTMAYGFLGWVVALAFYLLRSP